MRTLIILLALTITWSPKGEPLWRFKPCILNTPTERLLERISAREYMMYRDFHNYRCR